VAASAIASISSKAKNEMKWRSEKYHQAMKNINENRKISGGEA
jgi:hypothetical protein